MKNHSTKQQRGRDGTTKCIEMELLGVSERERRGEVRKERDRAIERQEHLHLF